MSTFNFNFCSLFCSSYSLSPFGYGIPLEPCDSLQFLIWCHAIKLFNSLWRPLVSSLQLLALRSLLFPILWFLSWCHLDRFHFPFAHWLCAWYLHKTSRWWAWRNFSRKRLLVQRLALDWRVVAWMIPILTWRLTRLREVTSRASRTEIRSH